MRVWRPKTMAGMVAAGCLLAAAPLLAAVVMTEITLNRLIVKSERLVVDGVSVERLGAQLRDNINALERNARQYAALGDAALLNVFLERLRETGRTVQDIEKRSYHATMADGLNQLRLGLSRTEQIWTQTLQDAVSFDAAVASVQALSVQAEAIIVAGRAAVDAEMEQLRAMTAAARWAMWLSSAALILLAALLATGISLAVARPVKRMSLGIAALGHARYNQPIRIEYPEEMRRLGELLDWLRRKLTQLESDKNLFLRNVSHELKTPLATLREGTALLREGSLGLLTPRQAEVAKLLDESAAELGARVANLLAYAEWRADRRRESRAWFELRPLIEETLSAQKLLMARRALTAELDLRTPRLFGQRTQWRVALDNLVLNAIKHAPQGTAIGIHAAINDGHCRLWVRDRGRGVPAADREKIFEPFVRGDKAMVDGVPGSGVGLSVVRETVLAHGGTTEVEDAKPGACFKLEWPCVQPEQ